MFNRISRNVDICSLKVFWNLVFYLLLISSLFDVISAFTGSELGGLARKWELKPLTGEDSETSLLALDSLESAKGDPNFLQDLMAQAFIRSASGLFGTDEYYLPDHEQPLDHQDRRSCLINKAKQCSAKEMVPSAGLRDDPDDTEYSGRYKTYLTGIESKDRTTAPLVCHRIGQRRVECSREDIKYNIVLPKDKMSRHSINSLIRNIYNRIRNDQRLHKRHIFNNFRGTRNLEEISRTLTSYGKKDLQPIKLGSMTIKRNRNLTGRKAFMEKVDDNVGEGPPVELSLPDKYKDKTWSKWIRKRQPRIARFPTMEDYRKCRPSRCKKKLMRTECPSINEGRTARIDFPATHRCIVQTCPCLLTTEPEVERTTCPVDEETYYAITTCRNRPPPDNDCQNDCQSKKRNKQNRLGKRSCECSCSCGCRCQSNPLHHHPKVGLGKASCGCSCGCGCSDRGLRSHRQTQESETH